MIVCVWIVHKLKPGYSSSVSSPLCTFSTAVRSVSISKNDVKMYGSFHDVLGMACMWRLECRVCQPHWVMKDTVALGSELWVLDHVWGLAQGSSRPRNRASIACRDKTHSWPVSFRPVLILCTQPHDTVPLFVTADYGTLDPRVVRTILVQIPPYFPLKLLLQHIIIIIIIIICLVFPL